MRNQKGYTIVESLIAIGLVAFIACALALGMFQYRKIIAHSQTNHSIERQIKEIVENIRPNINLYQVNYDQNQRALETALDVTKLPMAWAPGKTALVEECPQCPGRYGFTVRPFPNWPGLYVLTLRMSHSDWGHKVRDYHFLVTTK